MSTRSKKLISALVLPSLLPLFLVFPITTSAADEKQLECFNQLQSSVVSIPSFAPVHEDVKKLVYGDVQREFSPYYKNISSFGVDLRSPDFDMRIYSFGPATGYQHPPFSPFPTYTLSDKWEEPANQFIIAEEYVRNTETNERVFLSCSFMVIDTGSPKKVTAERYLSDGPLTSIVYTAPSGTYKTWYSKNKSYDHTGMEFVTWERLFVYPKSTENNFFSRYTVLDAFPARTTDDLSNIVNIPKFLKGDKDLLNPPEMKGYDTVFALNSYYQAIENTYPKFAEKLALRGVLQYQTVKELLATRGVSEFSAIWDTVLNPNEITKYALLKEKGELVKDNGDGVIAANEESAFFEEQLNKISSLTLEGEAQYLLNTVSARNPLLEEGEEEVLSFWDTYGRHILIGGGLVLVAILGGVLVMVRRRRIIHEDIIA